MKTHIIKIVILLGALCQSLMVIAQPRTAFVHLFEWKWQDIAVECEQVLGPKGFAAVQVSPPQKSHNGSQWWSRYQPVSYSIEGRSGDRGAFQDMVNRCQASGVDIYVDAVINHMASYDRNFPEVPYGFQDFHTCTRDPDYSNRWEVQNCDLLGLNDLKTESEYVRQKLADYMNDLISMGVKGFRIDAAKHMPTEDIDAIINKLNGNPYIFQEVIWASNEPIQPSEYVGNGDVTEFRFEETMGHYFKGRGPLKDLVNIGRWDGWLQSNQAVVFVSNHDDQRQDTNNTLTYKDVGNLYYIAEIFMLAYPYGYPKVMSSYYFSDHDQGPPSSGPHSGDACTTGGWVCEHRWRGIANMVAFRNNTADQWRVSHWWDNGNNQIAFGRGGKGFVAINRENSSTLSQTLQTGMAQGNYCDIINGEFDKNLGTCSGPVITVNADGTAAFNVSSINATAIHVGAVVGDGCSDDCNSTSWNQAYFRGTANSWGSAQMTETNGVWVTEQVFGEGDNEGGPRFKISRFADWSEAYPAQDVRITQGAGRYKISFNDNSKTISVEKLGDTGGGNVNVSFTCLDGVTYTGQSVYVVGNVTELGAWEPSDAVKLTSSSYPSWTGIVSLPRNTSIEWKCLKREDTNVSQGLEWQSGSNNVLNTNTQNSATGSF